MGLKFNADRLLAGRENSFLKEISISKEKRKELHFYKDLVREAIRAEFSDVRIALEHKNYAALSQITEMNFSEKSEKDDAIIHVLKTLKPKFWTQGSMTYGTLNMPAKMPPQQIDIDDGVYLPMHIFEGQPAVAKDAFFKIVDSALKKLCSDNGWHHDDTKDNCSRIIVDYLIHIDVPLYAIPKEKYVALSMEDSATALLESIQPQNKWLYVICSG
jgi:hypothetical protein